MFAIMKSKKSVSDPVIVASQDIEDFSHRKGHSFSNNVSHIIPMEKSPEISVIEGQGVSKLGNKFTGILIIEEKEKFAKLSFDRQLYKEEIVKSQHMLQNLSLERQDQKAEEEVSWDQTKFLLDT